MENAMRRRLVSRSVSIAAVVAVLGAGARAPALSPAGDEYPYAKAPDGHRGFGDRPDPDALRELFRKAEGEDVRFLSELYRVARDVEVLAALARGRYARLGYFGLLEGRPPTQPRDDVADLYRAFEAARVVAGGEPLSHGRARALARALVDERFRAREPVLTSYREDVRELRGSLALFVAHARGRAELTEGGELVALAQRADLAAARLRALRLDLEALHEPIAAPPVGRAGSEELHAVLREGRPSETLLALAGAAEAGARRLADSLFTPRFDETHGRALAARADGRRRAERALLEMRLLIPTTEEGRAATRFADMRAVDRYRRAADAGSEGLHADPLHADVQYLMGIAVDFFAGHLESARYFDRFLALRGVRHWEYDTFGHRDLDAAEEYALLVVADWRPTTGEDE